MGTFCLQKDHEMSPGMECLHLLKWQQFPSPGNTHHPNIVATKTQIARVEIGKSLANYTAVAIWTSDTVENNNANSENKSTVETTEKIVVVNHEEHLN